MGRDLSQIKEQRFQFQPVNEFLKRPRASWIIKGVLPSTGLCVLFGESGSGKSFFTLDMAAAVARGAEWRGLKVKQGKVAYICAEGAADFRDRVEAYENYHGARLENLTVLAEPPNLLETTDVRDLVASLKSLGPLSIVVIDTAGRPFVLVKGVPCYDFDRKQYAAADIITPLSRTFIPSRISDNPYLMGTGYMAQLQSLPEPLRSQMLKGDFGAGMKDDPWQVIPTAWVEAAQARWKRPDKLPAMDSMGVDVARGGEDKTAIARRHGMWFDEPLAYAGSETPDGPSVAGLVIAAMRDQAPIHIDVIGVGASPYDFLNDASQHVIGVNVAEKSYEKDKSGRLGFFNQRSQYWWQMREALDPANNTGICLPPSKQLAADLCAPKWEMRGFVIKVEGREEIIKRIGRSPDLASAYILALIDTAKITNLRNQLGALNAPRREYDPFSVMR